MFNFNSWIVGIAGGSLIISLFEMIAPFGKMGSFCKSIFGVFYIYIIFNPIIEMIKLYI